jgi:hypothetical protein
VTKARIGLSLASTVGSIAVKKLATLSAAS